MLNQLLSSAALGAIWVYQRSLSPVLYFFGARCRHYPSCSAYSADAFRKHGAWRGFWLTLSRLARCHPLGSSGVDPVPEGPARPWWRLDRQGDWSWRERD
ncbi:MAG: membrane protein insertion efficiency factor YidD [Marinicaulis sp.]|nr:membrane protein insertion efficiency factor YidD [Marinicaulis sp.]NNE40224.1 membrane protein insertion efficiency factor YidD [Marinicaulis sp.]NNL90167.1 membrane protein insertion efficiency factor YidD [Marinicaulis sp.]